LASYDFCLFPKITSALKGQRFQDTEDIQKIKKNKKRVMALKAIPQQEFQKCFQPWQHGWVKCITAQGKYFKGNHASVSCKYTDMLAVKQFRELYGHTSYFFGSLFFHLSLAGRGKCSSGCPF
jgi:hypothetical protein